MGKPMASVIQSYEIALYLSKLGYNTSILHEKDKYSGVKNWLGEEFANIKHYSFKDLNENPNMQLTAADMFIVPEIYAEFLKTLHEKRIPSEKIVLLQHQWYMFKNLNHGDHYRNYGVEYLITSSEKIKNYINTVQFNLDIKVINPLIHESFKKSAFPIKPSVAVFCRNPDDLDILVKLFYQKYPMYGWVSMKTMGSMPRDVFANSLNECALAVWVDDHSTFGTFPLECMASNVPVIAKLPNIIPEWAEVKQDDKVVLSNNAIYVSSMTDIPDYIAQFMDSWLIDSVNEDIYANMQTTPLLYNRDNFNEQVKATFEGIFAQKIEKIQNTINSYKTV